MPKPEPKCTLSVVVAGDQRTAVVFRQGPRLRVEMIRWSLASDTFERGQWFKGRVYSGRCSLSHDGELLVYFVRKQPSPFTTWSAISRPPYFTALALWPKGDSWGGGGFFQAPRHLVLEHRQNETALAPGFELPKRFRVEALQGRQFEDALDSWRREGWQTLVTGTWNGTGGFTPARVFSKSSPRTKHLALHRWYKHVRRGGKITPNFGTDLVDAAGTILRRYGEPDWLDWAPNGDLLVSDAGRLFRISKHVLAAPAADILADAKMIADFRDDDFTTVAPPPWATQWPWVARRRQ